MSAPASTDTPAEALATLRARLDAVDTGIHRLLRERFEIVEAIGAEKGSDGPVIRPAREAAVIENRLALHKGSLPPVMLAHIWRVLISAACAVQRPFSVHTSGALAAALFLYGPVPVHHHPNARDAVRALGDGDIAVVPEASAWVEGLGLPEDGAGPAGVDEAPHVIARVTLSGGSAVVVIAGAKVSHGAGPEAAVLRDGAAHFISASDIVADDTVLGRYHPFPVEIPAFETSS